MSPDNNDFDINNLLRYVDIWDEKEESGNIVHVRRKIFSGKTCGLIKTYEKLRTFDFKKSGGAPIIYYIPRAENCTNLWHWAIDSRNGLFEEFPHLKADYDYKNGCQTLGAARMIVDAYLAREYKVIFVDNFSEESIWNLLGKMNAAKRKFDRNGNPHALSTAPTRERIPEIVPVKIDLR